MGTKKEPAIPPLSSRAGRPALRVARTAAAFLKLSDRESRIGVISCGQYYPRLGRVKLTIVDFGIGIPEDVRRYSGHPVRAYTRWTGRSPRTWRSCRRQTGGSAPTRATRRT